MAESRYMTINMGPQHPATHGVLRLLLELDGEIIVKAEPHIGYLHRGIEKLAESMTYPQALTLTDRLDYTSALSNNLAYCLAVEKLLDINIPKRAQYLRVLMAELQRIAAHLLWLATHALDLGAMTLLFYAFRERETIMEILELATGARLTPSFIRIGGLASDIPDTFLPRVKAFVEDFPKRMDDYETLLTENIIWKKRTTNIAPMSAEECIQYGVTGPVLRASGVSYDVRKAYPYSSYEDFDFEIPLGRNGDVYDRYLVRLIEMRQSNRIVKQAAEKLPGGPFAAVDAPLVVPPAKEEVGRDIAALIRHFKIMEEGFRPPCGEVYASVESSKGELGFYLISDGTNKPFRMRIRPPSFINLAALPKMIEGQMVADVVAAIGSIDIVLGEIDR
ncbi:MAG: NADH dehydrogenase (quinone) subunit D [Proteobacteria bacterium]|nr:NADH dehydrogenase (quinone) subunit D [Pseudomonadota bacterium]MBU4580859.1 NADH dehydrogenase (quinone) subunit D [Pseudomonadota bacterium]MCG2739654.1 NADH dehydrogenase (quinone) subunit D [Syntrophaceae bacterium]